MARLKDHIQGLQSGKHLQLTKAQKYTLVSAGVSVFVVVFTIVATISLVGKWNFQGRVIDAKQKALDQLKQNQKAVSSLATSYKAFVDTPYNAIGGDSTGTGAQDGSNAKLVIDALPSKYDFPALTSSIEKIIVAQNMDIKGISGSDDQTNQQDNLSSASPQPVDMPFSFSASGGYDQVKSLIGQFEHSIRPFQFQTVELRGGQDDMTLSVTAQTYYQPSIKFEVRMKDIK